MSKINNLDLRPYSKLLSREPQTRVVIGFNSDMFGNPVVTTGVPVQYKPEATTYVRQKRMSYDEYMFRQFQKNYR